MVTFTDLFQFVIVISSVASLFYIIGKNQRNKK